MIIPRELDIPLSTRHSARMKIKGDVIYLTEKEWNAFKEQEHQERLALSARVARGEITALEANREASIFKHVPSVAEVPINFAEAADRLLGLKPRRTRNGRRAKNTVRA